MDDLTDEALMVMFQQGDAAAFERLFERYRVPVFNFLVRLLTHQRLWAEDVLQDIFIKLANARDLYDPHLRFRPWLFTIARNHGLNHLRSRAAAGARNSVSLDELTEPTADRPGHELAGKEDTFGTIASKDDLQNLERTIDRLPPPSREIFLLRAMEGLAHEEIAQVLDLNPATVRTHFHRARAQLCRWLSDQPLEGATP